MLKSRHCSQQCIRYLDAVRFRDGIPPFVIRSNQRFASTLRSSHVENATTENLGVVDRILKYGHDKWKGSAMAANQKKWERSAVRPQARRDINVPNMTKLGRRDPSMSVSDWERRKREMRHLQDPLSMATFVKKELSKGKTAEMLQLVRMASPSMQCVVSWNHIIDHLLANERVSEALKVYNEMKKRAQFPDSYTYTILLRGLSLNAHTSGALNKALSVYHSLSAPNARIEPSIIHTNAALLVCARARDMDALWGVVGKLPERGAGAANAVTYVTLLNAIRQSSLLGIPKGETEDETALRRERGVMEGRRIWIEVIKRWRNAELVIDEELVCAMGRLLLIGSRPRDWDDVLSLVEQTMDIPRLVPRLGTIERQQARFPFLRAPNVPTALRFDDDHLSPDQAPMRGDEFLADIPQDGETPLLSPHAYAKPGNNTLSLVMEACQKVAVPNVAREYWDVLTNPMSCDIVPDFENLTMSLRNMRQNRASRDAVKLLRDDMINQGFRPRPGTFRIAMSTCVRDANNHNSFKHAGEILELMLKTLQEPDTRTLTLYANHAFKFPLAKGQDLVDALTILYPFIKLIRLRLGPGSRSDDNDPDMAQIIAQRRADDISFLRKTHSLYDRLLFSNLIPEDQKPPFKAEKARLSAFIQRVEMKDFRKSQRIKLDSEGSLKKVNSELDEAVANESKVVKELNERE